MKRTKSYAGFDPLGAGDTAPSKPSVQTRQLLTAMGEQTANLTALMETLLSRFDEEKVLADKRAEAQTAFNNQVSQELQSLTKQIGLTQADVDDVRKVTSPSASSAPSSGSQVEEGHNGVPVADFPLIGVVKNREGTTS